MKSHKVVILLYIFIILIGCLPQQYQQGESLYLTHCAHCHMNDGQGLRSLIPPLANSDYLELFRSDLPCIIRNGISGPVIVNGKEYDLEMPGVPYLKPVEIQNIINYISSSWGNNQPFFQVQDVNSSLENCK